VLPVLALSNVDKNSDNENFKRQDKIGQIFNEMFLMEGNKIGCLPSALLEGSCKRRRLFHVT